MRQESIVSRPQNANLCNFRGISHLPSFEKQNFSQSSIATMSKDARPLTDRSAKLKKGNNFKIFDKKPKLIKLQKNSSEVFDSNISLL